MIIIDVCILSRQAFIAVERSYLESIDDKLAERASLVYEIPEGMKPYEAYQSHPQVVSSPVMSVIKFHCL